MEYQLAEDRDPSLRLREVDYTFVVEVDQSFYLVPELSTDVSCVYFTHRLRTDISRIARRKRPSTLELWSPIHLPGFFPDRPKRDDNGRFRRTLIEQVVVPNRSPRNDDHRDGVLRPYMAGHSLAVPERTPRYTSMVVVAVRAQYRLTGEPSPVGKATARVLAGFRRTGAARSRGPATGV